MLKKFLLVGVIFLGVIACTRDFVVIECNGEQPTYSTHIKTILETNCTTSGCHETRSGLGDFTDFEKLSVYIEDGSFEAEVITNQTMPLGSTLNESDLELIQCWINDGYPE